MGATIGSNRRPIQPTGFMRFTSAMKITGRLSASLKEKFSAQPMAAKIGGCNLARQPGCLASILQITIRGRSLATMVRYLEPQTEAKTGPRKQAEQSISSEQFGSQTPTRAQL